MHQRRYQNIKPEAPYTEEDLLLDQAAAEEAKAIANVDTSETEKKKQDANSDDDIELAFMDSEDATQKQAQVAMDRPRRVPTSKWRGMGTFIHADHLPHALHCTLHKHYT